MLTDTISLLQQDLHDRATAGGGFRSNAEGEEGVDSTAWAVHALRLIEGDSEPVRAGRRSLAALQSADGSLPYTPETPAAYWPTPLALLAWHTDDVFSEHRKKAVSFLLHSGGNTTTEILEPLEDDFNLRGWSWIADTFSWVEPTAMVLMALASQSQSDHPRYREGVALLLDRMLPIGGWNYGNKKVFGTTLRPFPESTGMALCALKNDADERLVEKSLAYLETAYPRATTPLSLSWTLLGLRAYGRFPGDARERIGRCLGLQDRYGPFATSLLAQLALAAVNP